MGDRLVGLNDSGDVVWRYSDSVSGQTHGAIWSYGGSFGLAPRTMIDLNSISGLSIPTLARDINNNGWIVGEAAISPGVTRAYVWQLLSGGTATPTNLGLFPESDSDNSSSSMGINNAVPPLVVGWSGFPNPVDLGPQFVCETVLSHAFRRLMPGTAIEHLYPFGWDPGPPIIAENWHSTALSVSLTQQPVGHNTTCGLVVGVGTTGLEDGVYWSNTSPFPPAELIPIPNVLFIPPVLVPTDRGTHHAHAINDSGNIVGIGYGLPPLPPLVSGIGAPYWESAGAAPFNLREVLDEPTLNQAAADGINNPDANGDLSVVGWNINQGRGLEWRRADGVWSVSDLNTRIGPCAGVFVVREATDINGDSWIAGHVQNIGSGPTQLRAVLLIPSDTGLKCRSDFNCDCRVDGIDLGLLLAAWSIPPTAPGCGGATPCYPDLNGDGLVNGNDLGIFLSDWPVGTEACDPVCDGQLPLSGFSFSPEPQFATAGAAGPTLEQLVQALSAVGLDDLAQLLQEVYGQD
jgi:hypothetical protein